MPNSSLFPARVSVVLSTGHRLDVRVTDAEAAKIIKQVAKLASKDSDRV